MELTDDVLRRASSALWGVNVGVIVIVIVKFVGSSFGFVFFVFFAVALMGFEPSTFEVLSS